MVTTRSTPAAHARGRAGRTRLLDAAEVLLDQAGIDGTTGAAIVAASGHRNAAAVNYHFGNLDALIRAVLRRRADVLDETRNHLLDELEERGSVTARDALAAMVAPLIDLLDDPAGRRYVRLLNQAANHPRFHGEANWEFAGSLARGAVYLAPLVSHLPQHRQRPRARNVLGYILYSLASRAAAIDTPLPDSVPLSPDEFSEDLLNSVVGALRA